MHIRNSYILIDSNINTILETLKRIDIVPRLAHLEHLFNIIKQIKKIGTLIYSALSFSAPWVIFLYYCINIFYFLALLFRHSDLYPLKTKLHRKVVIKLIRFFLKNYFSSFHYILNNKFIFKQVFNLELSLVPNIWTEFGKEGNITVILPSNSIL